jgi:MFS family permease
VGQPPASLAVRTIRGMPPPLAILFVLDGFVRSTGIVRVPNYKSHVGASATAFGFALLCNSFGALVGMPVAGRLCERIGTHRLIVFGSLLACGIAILPAISGSIVTLAASFFAFGVIYGAAEVGLNSGAVEVESATRRSIMSPLHGLFSLGELGGALVGAGLARFMSPGVHLTVVGVAMAILIGLTAPSLLRDGSRLRAFLAQQPTVSAATEAAASSSKRSLSHPKVMVLILGVIALCTAYGEGSIGDWGAIHLHEGMHVSVSAAAYGYAAFASAITASRFVGPAIIARIGERALVVVGGLLAAGGMLVAAWTHNPGIAVAGYVAVGLGLANVFPVAIARAGAIGGPRGVATASTLGLFGMLVGPALIGFIADRSSLPTGLSTVAFLGLLAGALSFVLRGDKDQHRAALVADPAAESVH